MITSMCGGQGFAPPVTSPPRFEATLAHAGRGCRRVGILLGGGWATGVGVFRAAVHACDRGCASGQKAVEGKRHVLEDALQKLLEISNRIPGSGRCEARELLSRGLVSRFGWLEADTSQPTVRISIRSK